MTLAYLRPPESAASRVREAYAAIDSHSRQAVSRGTVTVGVVADARKETVRSNLPHYDLISARWGRTSLASDSFVDDNYGCIGDAR